MAKLSPHWLNYHGYGIDSVLAYQSDFVKLVDPDPEQARILAEDHGLRVIARLFPLTEPRYDQNPVTVAEADIHTIRGDRSFPDVWGWETLNEPAGLTDPLVKQWLRDYWLALIAEADNYGIRICWGSFGTGNPPGVGDQGSADWTPYAQVFEAAGQFHPLAVHEYWSDEGPLSARPWWVDRLSFVPGQGSIVVTECGLDRAVGHPDRPQSGWQGIFSEAQYLSQIADYAAIINQDSRVLTACVFTHDYSSPHWASFDTRYLGEGIAKINALWGYGKPPQSTPSPSPGVDWVAVRRYLQGISADTLELECIFSRMNDSVGRLLNLIPRR